ncbi:MAG TPA: DUF6580 family putative transport protein [Waddliaceae bacterium]
MYTSRILAILGFIFLGIASRLVPHPPNFTAINAVALLGVCSLGSLWLSLLTVFIIMFLTDLILGLHCSLLFVYLSYGLVTLMGHWVSSKKSLLHNALLLIFSSLVFFLITNFGVWLTCSIYPKTLPGLGICYLAAIPFLANQIVGNFFYAALILFPSVVFDYFDLEAKSFSR